MTFSSSTGFFCLFKDRVLFHVFILWYLQVLYAYGTVNASLSQSTASINTYLGFTSIFKAVGYLSVHMQHFLNVLPWSIWDTPPFCLRIIVHWFFFTLSSINKIVLIVISCVWIFVIIGRVLCLTFSIKILEILLENLKRRFSFHSCYLDYYRQFYSNPPFKPLSYA